MPPGKKTLFLIYLLVQRLGDRQAVVLRSLGCEDYYALFRDTVTFHPVNKSEPPDQCPSVWALCDSNADATSPPSVFKGQTGHVRITDHAAQDRALQGVEQTSRR